MIRSIRIRGLGPHADTRLALDPKGSTTVFGPSEAGKSTLMDAICFALWGWSRSGRALPVEAVRDGAEEARVELEMSSGTRIERALRVTAKGGRSHPIRSITRRGQDPEAPRTEADWLTALDRLGQSPELLRLALVPMGWLALADGPGNGRPLRDALNALLPTTGTRNAVIAEIMAESGHQFAAGDPINERDAGALRTRRKTERDRAVGRVDTLREQLETLEATDAPEAPTLAEVADAQDIVTRADAWESGAAARERTRRREAEREAAAKAQAGWDARKEALGARPEAGAGLDEAKERVASTAQAQVQADQALRHADRDVAQAEGAIAPREPGHPAELAGELNQAARRLSDAIVAAESVTDICPTCHRDGWVDAQARAQAELADARAAKAAAEAALTEAIEGARGAEADRQAAAKAELARLTRLRDAEAAKAAELKLAADEALRQMAEARAGAQPAVEWEATLRGLGARPTIPAPIPGPPEPSCACPEPAEAEAARAVLTQRDRAQGAVAERERRLADLESSLSAAEQALGRLVAEVERLEALVAAIRAEPSESVRRQLAALGELGPVSLRLADEGGVQVLVDGRPWSLASTGRQVVADTWLRLGIRRVLGTPWLPIIVDCTQDVGGQDLPPIPGPSILLRTTDDPGLIATTGAP